MRTNFWILALLFLFGGCADTHYRAQQIVATLDKQPVVSQQLSDARRTQRINPAVRPAPSVVAPALQAITSATAPVKPIYVPQTTNRVLKKVEYDSQITPSQNAAYYALLIGIDQYPHFTPLETAVRDVNALDALLRREYGFQTVVIRNDEATRENIVEAINAFRKKLTQHDKFLIYYAGHGHFDKETDTSYWIPYDATSQSDTNYIEAKSIVTTNLKRIAAKQVLVVADSCYAGTLSRSTDIRLQTDQSNRSVYLEKLKNRPSRILIASGGNEPVADGGGSGHSIFARALIEGLGSPDRSEFTAEELFVQSIRERVGGSANQLPEYKIIRDSGHEGGDFVFTRASGAR
jgi:hypothetical protein